MWALQDARLTDGSTADVAVDRDRIVRVGPVAAAGVAETIDCGAKLVLPALIDGHVHLDKVLIRDELMEHDGTLAAAIAAVLERKRRYTLADLCARAASVIEESVPLG